MLVSCYLPPVLTARQLAAALVVSVGTIYRLHKNNRLPPPVRVGRSLRWDRESVLKFIGCSIPC